MSFGRHAAPFVFVCLAAAWAWGETVNRIVATVDGDPITAHEVQRYGEERHAHGVTESDLLEAVITDKILEKEIAARKIVARAEDIDRYVDDIMTRNHLTPVEFEKAMKDQGLTLEAYKRRVKGEMEKTQLLGQEIRTNVTVTDEEIQRYYDAHREEFATRRAVVVRDIFFGFRAEMTQGDVLRLIEQAKAVKQKIVAGQSFAELARHYSEGPGAANGGLLGTFRRGEMDPTLEQVAFALGRGEVSQPLLTPHGIHLLKVDDVQTEGEVSLDDVKEQIRQALANQALDERFREWISKNLRDRHHIEVLE